MADFEEMVEKAAAAIGVGPRPGGCSLTSETERTARHALTAAGVPDLLPENERLRRIELAVQRACTHDSKCEEEGEGGCCYRAWRAVVLAAGCATPTTDEDVQLLAALEREARS